MEDISDCYALIDNKTIAFSGDLIESLSTYHKYHVGFNIEPNKDDFDFVDEVAEQYVKFIPEEDISSNPQFIELCMLLGQYVPEGLMQEVKKFEEAFEFYKNDKVSYF